MQKPTSESFHKHVNTLISVLVPPGGEEIEGVIQIKVVVAIEVPTNKVIDLLLGDLMEVLEFMHGAEFDDVEAVRKDTV